MLVLRGSFLFMILLVTPAFPPLLPFSPLAVFADLEEQEAKAVLPTAKAAPDKEVLKKFLLFNVINSLDYFLSIGLPGTGTTKPLISIFPKFKSFGV